MQRTEVQPEVPMRHCSPCVRLGGALLVGAVVTTSSAQSPAATRTASRTVQRLAGAVLDTAGAPVPLADVRLAAGDGWHHALLTDGDGHFVFTLVPVGPAQLEVRRLGFRPITRTLTIAAADDAVDSTRVVLAAAASALTGIEVNDHAESFGALAGFYARRRSNNFGHYLDRAEIEATHAQRPSEALRTVPGLLVQPSRRVGNVIRIRNCRPTIWIDGIRIQDAELDEVTSVDDVAAVEIYKSLAGLPQQFIDRTNPCGAILVWSRIR